MKKIIILAVVILGVFVFSRCHSAKKASGAVVKSTYENNMQTLVGANCSPCHFPAKGGNKKALDNYDSLKANIDDVIRRIELNPTDRGFMPFKHPKLSDSTIAVFKKWRDDGMLDK
jgi:hypothetical protein